jgi:hypothetical protein
MEISNSKAIIAGRRIRPRIDDCPSTDQLHHAGRGLRMGFGRKDQFTGILGVLSPLMQFLSLRRACCVSRYQQRLIAVPFSLRGSFDYLFSFQRGDFTQGYAQSP